MLSPSAMLKNKVLGALFLVAGSGSLAAAESRFSVTTNPVIDAVGLPDVTVEAHADEHIGIAATVGAGLPVDGNRAVLVGGSFNYYVFREFSGLHLGVEGFYFHQQDSGMPVNWWTMGVGGAYVGYKYIHSSGVTASAEGGVGYLHSSNSDRSPYWNFNSAVPLLHLQLGYSF